MTDTIDEQKLSDVMRLMTASEIADMQEKAYARNAPWGDRHYNGQAYMNNAYRQMLDNLDKPRRLTRWQRFVYWFKDLFL